MNAFLQLLLLVFVFRAGVSHAQFSRAKSARCFNPNQRPGTCVSIYDCQTLLSVLQRVPLQPFDVEFVKASECTGGYGNGPHVCCASDTGFTRPQPVGPSAREDPNWETQQSTVLFPTNFGGPLPPDFIPNAPQPSRGRGIATREVAAGLPQPPICGGVTIENKIYGGSDADLYEFPWMALLEYNRKSGGISVNCAGSLINQRYVLTAAHCVTGAIEKQIGQLVAIRLGEHDQSSKVDCNGFGCADEAYRVGIEDLIPHEYYRDSSINKENDIALVRVDRNIRFTDSIRPICLPSAVAQEQTPKSGTQYTVAGWGRTLRSAKSVIKQKLNVALVGQQKCARKFLERKVNIVPSQLCAGGKFAEDSCEGDSGGPLMRVRSGVWVLEGVVSFGVKCGLRDWPAVHTRVESFDSWIRSNIRG